MNTYIRARIDSELKARVEQSAKDMGVSMSDYLRMALLSFSRDERDAWRPDKTTQEALKQFDTGKANKATDSDFMELLGLTK
jgi:DNA-damage-inducible protein J